MNARYETVVRRDNQAGSRGRSVTVYASSEKEARRKAVALGWPANDARAAVVTIVSVVEVDGEGER